MTTLQTQDPSVQFCNDLLVEKYAVGDEKDAAAIQQRVAQGLARDDKQQARFQQVMRNGFVPGGRINRSIGSSNITTAINCFVQPVGDSMSGFDANGLPGITDALAQAAETMRRGGGVGYDFSPIRPRGALVKGTSSQASGPVSYMRMFDKMCETVQSAGARRGAQMGILRCDHPDVFEFVNAKRVPDFQEMGLSDKQNSALLNMMQQAPGFGWPMRQAFAKLANFNVSVAVTDEFMEAVLADGEFDLVHEAQPFQPSSRTKVCADGKTRFVYRTIKARELWELIMRNTYDAAEPGVIFIDRVNRDNNLHYCESIRASNPCGEQFLPAYGCCDLGSINLSRYVVKPFTKKAHFDLKAMEADVKAAVELLDRVLDVTNWPLKEQGDEAQQKRRIGLGYFALADALAMLNLRYDSDAAVAAAKEITEAMSCAAYNASVDLAIELGAFPLFDADKYLQPGTFASRLPEAIQKRIRQFGIRNSHLLSIAPTGTISMAFGGNASSGIEPIFSVKQKRTKRTADGGFAEFILENNAYRLARESGQPVNEEVFDATALKISVDGHMKMLEAIAPHIDSAISKTINVPADYPYEDFKNVYLRAWKSNIKGITTYRPNTMVGAVLEDASDKQEPATSASLSGSDPDRRIELKEVSAITETLRWPNRPAMPQGLQSLTFHASHTQGDFAVVVGYYQNGSNCPVETYVAGNEQPRSLSALAKVLSVDMRTGDAGWLRMKLESLRNTQADDGFEMLDPKSGVRIVAPSLVSGFAHYIEFALERIGFSDQQASSSVMLDALFSKREPKTDASGSLSWSVDIHNPVTGDDFLVTLKEVRMPDGTVRPYSIWVSGKYPRVLDGLCKLLSIDMRISDPAWIVMKLRKLLNYSEPRGDFLAQVPGGKKQQNYPSTVAYIAAVVLERMRVLGVVTQDLEPVHKSAEQPSTAASHADQEGNPLVGTGMACPSCHTMSLHKQDGCKVCAHCGYTGECG